MPGDDLARALPDGGHARLPHQVVYVRSGISLGQPGEVLQAHVLVERHLRRRDLEYLEPRDLVRRDYLHEAVEPARPHQGRVQHVGPVRRCYHHDVLEAAQPVHLGQHGVHDPLGHHRPGFAVPGPPRGYRVYLVYEQHARGGHPGLLEYLADGLLGLADVLGEHLRPAYGDEVRLALVRDGLGEQGLAGARGAVEEDALYRPDPHLLEQLGLLQRQLYGLLYLPLYLGHPSDVAPFHGRPLDVHLAQGGRLDLVHRVEEILPADDDSLQDGGRQRLLLYVDEGKHAPEGLYRRFLGEQAQVGPGVPVSDVRYLGYV